MQGYLCAGLGRRGGNSLVCSGRALPQQSEGAPSAGLVPGVKKGQWFHVRGFLQTMVKWVSVSKLVLLLCEINSLWEWREDVSLQVSESDSLRDNSHAQGKSSKHTYPSLPLSLGSLPRWSTDGSPDLHVVKIHGHNFQWLNYQKDVISSLIGKEEVEKKWSCLASVFLTAWMTRSHGSYLTGSLHLGDGCCWLKAWGWIQEHPMNTEHSRDRRQRPQSAGTAPALSGSDPAAARDPPPLHSAAFTLPRALKFCICSEQFWCAVPAPAKSRSRKQLFACISLPGTHHYALLSTAQEGLSSRHRGSTWLRD